MNRALLATLAIAIGVVSGTASAAETTDLTVGGKIIPPVCDVTLSTETLDFGTIPAASLSASTYTSLTPQYASMQIQCNAPTLMAVAALDGRSGSAATDIPMSAFEYGLGKVDGNNVGGYQLYVDSATADGTDAYLLRKEPTDAKWVRVYYDNINTIIRPARLSSWGSVATPSLPAPHTTIEQRYKIQPHVSKTGNLPALSSEVPLDGLITFQVQYL